MNGPAPIALAALPAFASVDRWCAISGQGQTKTYASLKAGHLRARKLGRRTLIDVAHGPDWLRAQPEYRPH